MKIGLIDMDNISKKRVSFPNLPLMKLSAYHKKHGDCVDWWVALEKYDLVYKSKVFDFTPEIEYPIYADRVVEGGSGYGLDNHLPDEVEHIMPDYSLYPQFNAAYGFLTRGCPRACPFCIVAPKEGTRSVKVADLSEFWNGQKQIKLLDPNLLACKEHEDLLQQLIDSGAWVDFTQGIDIRLVTKENAELLRRIKVKNIHFAWDNPKQDLSAQFRRFKEFSGIDYRKLGVYVLTNFDSTHEEDLYRIYTLRDLGYSPYVMIYNMAKMSMRVILKSGAEFTVKCDKFTLKRNGLEQVTGYNISGITENKPVYLDFDEVAAIVRVFSDEADAPPEDGGNEE